MNSLVTMPRYGEVLPPTFDKKSNTSNAIATQPMPNHPVIKDEASKRSACPYANKEKRDKAPSNVNVEKLKDSPARSQSPEFLLGSGDKKDDGHDKQQTTVKANVDASSVTCVYCNEPFPSKDALDGHVVNEHDGSSKKLYDCSVCEKHFTHRSSRDIHLRVHTGQRPYECEFCKKRFRVSSHLRDHVRTHTGERPFKCGVCGRGFKQSSDMKKHRKTHFKILPANPVTNESYMIVRPNETTTAVDHNPNALRTPTDQRQNLKLVIKRERKSIDTKSPGSYDCSTKTVSGNCTLPGEKVPEVSTQCGEIAKKAIENNMENFYQNGTSIIRSTKASYLSKNSPTKVAVKRKADRASKVFESNGYKAINTYPSMASGFSQMYAPSVTMGLTRHDPSITTAQNTVQTSGSPGEGQRPVEMTVSYGNQSSTQAQKQTSEVNEVFWQPESKVIKTEKLSPTPQEAPAHELSTADHELPTFNHGHGREEPTHGSELKPYDHEQPTNSHERNTYTHDRQNESEDNTMTVDDERTYNNDIATTTHEALTNGYDESNITSIDSVEQADDSNGAAEVPEDNPDVLPKEPEDVLVTSEAEVSVRKPMVVKIRQDKTGAKKTGTSFTVRRPIRLKDTEDDVQCNLCEDTFRNFNEFTAHKCGKNGKPFKCTICSKIFARATLLRQHMVLHQGSKRFRFKCNYCGRAFRHRSHLRDHERIHTGERPFKCSFCPKAFKQSSDHRKHENLHTGTTRYRCEKCSLDFKRCDALKRHAMMHVEGEVTLLKCEKCRSLFATADGHMSHVCMNKPYRYRCQICPERFTDADDLRRHCYDQHGEQSTLSCLKCEFCKLEFRNLQELDEHLGTHRLEKTHRCRTCDQRFSLLNQLVEHVKIHNTTHVRREDDPHPEVTAPSSLNQSNASQNLAEQTSSTVSQREQLNQAIESFTHHPTRTSPCTDKPASRRYDFIPSRYQSLLHANSVYGELGVGNWSRQNFYLPIQPKDTILSYSSRGQEAPTSPRDPPIASRSNTEVSQINASHSENTTESYRRNTDTSEVSARSSENGPTADRPPAMANPQTSPTANKIPDEFSTTSFAAYRAIALSRSAFHRTEITKRHRQTKKGEDDATGRRKIPTGNRQETNSGQNTPISIANIDDISHSPNVITRATEAYKPDEVTGENRRNHEEFRSDPEEARRYPERMRTNFKEKEKSHEVIHIDSTETRRYSEPPRIDPEEIQKYSEEVQRISDDFRIHSEGTRPNSEGRRSDPTHIQGDSTSENRVVSEEYITHRGLGVGSRKSHRSKVEMALAQSQQGVAKRKYTCLNCRLEFYRESSLVDHVCDILSETLYCCLVCEVHFEKYEDLQDHMRTHWKPVVYFKCTLCGQRLRTEELLKEHNLKHLEDDRAARNELGGLGHDEREKDGYHRIANGKTRDDHNDPSETFITPPGSAKSVTSPVIHSISGNVVTKSGAGQPASERGYAERRSLETEASPNTATEATNQNAVRDDVIARSTHGAYIPYYEARKQASNGYLNIFSQPAVVSAMHASMEASGRHHVSNGFLYPPSLTRPGHTVEHF